MDEGTRVFSEGVETKVIEYGGDAMEEELAVVLVEGFACWQMALAGLTRARKVNM